MRLIRSAASVAIALAALASCRADEHLTSPLPIDPMFRRYAALGNSITAGFQSVGIDDSTQIRAYPQLLAAAMRTTFVYPKLNGRGCPPPFTNNVTQTRVGGGTPTTCDLRVPTTGPLNSVAVPGNVVDNLLSNFGPPPSSFDPLKTFFLGGRTETELMTQLQPTFVSLWIGNNDVLGALTSLTNPGDPAQITSPTLFAAQYDSVLNLIQGTGAKAVLVSVADVSVLPYASRAAIYYCLKNGGCPAPLPPQDPTFAAIPTFTVNVNCAPPGGLSVLVPWPIGLTKLETAINGGAATIDCSVDNEVVTATELDAMQSAVTAYNAHIASEATTRGYAFFDVNSPLGALVASGIIPSFPNVTPALSGQSVDFGTIFSLDGVHPSSLAHRLLADSIASAINQKYGTGLPIPICGTVNCPAP